MARVVSDQNLRPLFCYGSLLNDEVFTRATGGMVYEKRVDGAILKGHRRVRVKNAAYPAALPYADHEIVGGLIFLKTVENWQILDRFESSDYKRETVSVVVPQDKGLVQMEADVYLWDRTSDLLEIHDWSYEKFLSKGKMQSSSLYDPQ